MPMTTGLNPPEGYAKLLTCETFIEGSERFQVTEVDPIAVDKTYRLVHNAANARNLINAVELQTLAGPADAHQWVSVAEVARPSAEALSGLMGNAKYPDVFVRMVVTQLNVHENEEGGPSHLALHQGKVEFYLESQHDHSSFVMHRYARSIDLLESILPHLKRNPLVFMQIVRHY